mgnify:CR=1 FL=1
MKHAYLILAHNEPELLSLLVERLDDVRNDIYIHFDRKLSILPDIKTQHAGLYILKDRVDVRWADVSMLEAEYGRGLWLSVQPSPSYLGGGSPLEESRLYP